MTDAKGQVFGYEYDELNRLTTTNYPVVTTPFITIEKIETVYDANNNIDLVTETKQYNSAPLTDITDNTWDNFDRLVNSAQTHNDNGISVPIDITYGYDNNGNRTLVSTENGSTTYEYDHRNRLQRAITSAGATVYTYTPDGQTGTITYANGAVADYDYDATNRTRLITHTDGSSQVISRFSYLYDDNGNRTQQIANQGGTSETTDYAYDDLDRLANFTVSSGADIAVTDYTFEGYNRKTETVSVNGTLTSDKLYVYDESNWLDSVTDAVAGTSVSYGYDENGNTISKTADGTETSFSYDVANRLVETIQSGITLGQYDYNADGMRIRHYQSERGNVEYFYDGSAVLEEFEVGASGGLLAHYRYGDRLLSLDTGTESQYYHHDALGSTVNLTDGTGIEAVNYTLDPWGMIKDQGGTGTTVNRQVFTGQEHDEQTGLIYFGARYYDPDTARFVSQDSYLGETGTPPSLHRYLYAYSNPTVWVDLDGHVVEPVSATVVGSAIVFGAIVGHLTADYDGDGRTVFEEGVDATQKAIQSFISHEDESGGLITTSPIQELPDYRPEGYGAGDTAIEGGNKYENIPEIMPPLTPGEYGQGIEREDTSVLINPDQSGEIDKSPHLSSGKDAREYNVTEHSKQPRPRGPFDSHHGIRKEGLKRNVPGYSEKKDPTILIDRKSQHVGITKEQAEASALRKEETGNPYGGNYGEWRSEAIDQMKKAGVPEANISRWVLEHDGYMFEIGGP